MTVTFNKSTGLLESFGGGRILPGLVLAGGFYVSPDGRVYPIPNGVEHPSDGQLAATVVGLLKSYALASSSEILGNSLNDAAESLASKFAAPIESYVAALNQKIATA